MNSLDNCPWRSEACLLGRGADTNKIAEARAECSTCDDGCRDTECRGRKLRSWSSRFRGNEHEVACVCCTWISEHLPPPTRHTYCFLSFRERTKDKFIVCLKFPEQPHVWMLVLLVQRIKCSWVWFLSTTWEDILGIHIKRHTSYKQCQISACRKHTGTIPGSP